ncbi:hypothetical protein BN946_scf184970.g146 [Trametes cinnabarina]|uniref:Major facilitator superfamily (MFS) profile domain-containing protein n=1 Tax=Pycnoporus cinnabarinus TaxID=5643 RepID=A0A060SJD5_PYCCI|nr:hypothetical protein BN946_scf184970.g146 [Trametes cinnabarina]
MADIEIEKHSMKESFVGVFSNSSATAVNDDPSRAPSVVDADDDNDRFPDGGAAAWLTVFGAFLALFCSFGQLNSFGTFQTWYAEHQLSHLPPSTIAWIGSLQLWVFFFSGAFVGRLFDAHGPRLILLFGSLILVFGTMMTSISAQYYQYVLAQGVLVAVGIGTVFYPSLAAISTHFKNLRSTALGIAIAGSGLGGVVYPIMYQQLFTRVGFAWTVRISGFISLVLCGVAIATITSRLPKPQYDAPWFDAKVLRDTPFRLVILGGILISFGLFIPSFYIVDYSTDRGISPQTAFYVLSVMNAGGIVGRLAPACLADVLGRFNILVPCAFLAGLSVLLFWTFAHSLVAIMLFAVVYGFFSGAFNALVIPCVVQISDVREYGTRIGVLYSIISFPALCGGPVAGAMLKAGGGSYLGMTMLSGATIIAGSLFMLWARLALSRRLCDRV